MTYKEKKESLKRFKPEEEIKDPVWQMIITSVLVGAFLWLLSDLATCNNILNFYKQIK